MEKPDKISLIDFITYFIGRSFLFFLYLLPLDVAILFTKWIARGIFRLDKRHRTIAMINLNIAFPELTKKEKRRLARASFENIGELVALVSKFPRLKDPDKLKKILRYCGDEDYRKAKSEGRPILFLTAHLGCWELISFGHAVLTNPISFIVRPLDHPLFEKLLFKYRTMSGNNAIPKKYALRRVLRALAKGGEVGILVDQNVQRQDGVFVDFFGKKACMTSGFATMAARSKAAVIPAVLVPDHENRVRYCIHLFPEVKVNVSDNKLADVQENTQRFAKVLEDIIRKWPDRWLWGHKRWKTRPVYDKENPYEEI